MKYYPLILLALLTACDKSEELPEYVPTVNRAYAYHSSKDIRTPKQGNWSGRLWYDIPELACKTISARREIRYTGDSVYLLRWWSFPDTTINVCMSDSIRYTMVYDVVNTNCGIQRSIIRWHSTGYVSNDTIYEGGTAEYELYFNNNLIIRSSGYWRSWVKFYIND